MTTNNIERLQRALFAQLSPLTGARATATVTVTAEAGGGDVVLPANSYLAPIVDGQYRPLWLFKVLPNPATVTGIVEHGTWQGGDWTVPDGATLDVDVVANIGGSQQNLPAGTPVRFEPAVPGILPDAVLATAGTGGTGGGLVKRMVLWELFAGPEAAFQYFQAGAGGFPALMLCWQSSSPLEGRTTGGNQGATRKNRRGRAFQENFTAYIAAGSLQSAGGRRNEGELAMLCATELLTDRRLNIDAEPLTQVGAGCEVTGRRIVTANRAMYVYQLDLVCNAIVEPFGDSAVDARTYPLLDRVNLTLALEGREAPEPTTPLDIVADVVIEV